MPSTLRLMEWPAGAAARGPSPKPGANDEEDDMMVEDDGEHDIDEDSGSSRYARKRKRARSVGGRGKGDARSVRQSVARSTMERMRIKKLAATISYPKLVPGASFAPIPLVEELAPALRSHMQHTTEPDELSDWQRMLEQQQKEIDEMITKMKVQAGIAVDSGKKADSGGGTTVTLPASASPPAPELDSIAAPVASTSQFVLTPMDGSDEQPTSETKQNDATSKGADLGEEHNEQPAATVIAAEDSTDHGTVLPVSANDAAVLKFLNSNDDNDEVVPKTQDAPSPSFALRPTAVALTSSSPLTSATGTSHSHTLPPPSSRARSKSYRLKQEKRQEEMRKAAHQRVQEAERSRITLSNPLARQQHEDEILRKAEEALMEKQKKEEREKDIERQAARHIQRTTSSSMIGLPPKHQQQSRPPSSSRRTQFGSSVAAAAAAAAATHSTTQHRSSTGAVSSSSQSSNLSAIEEMFAYSARYDAKFTPRQRYLKSEPNFRLKEHLATTWPNRYRRQYFKERMIEDFGEEVVSKVEERKDMCFDFGFQMEYRLRTEGLQGELEHTKRINEGHTPKPLIDSLHEQDLKRLEDSYPLFFKTALRDTFNRMSIEDGKNGLEAWTGTDEDLNSFVECKKMEDEWLDKGMHHTRSVKTVQPLAMMATRPELGSRAIQIQETHWNGVEIARNPNYAHVLKQQQKQQLIIAQSYNQPTAAAGGGGGGAAASSSRSRSISPSSPRMPVTPNRVNANYPPNASAAGTNSATSTVAPTSRATSRRHMQMSKAVAAVKQANATSRPFTPNSSTRTESPVQIQRRTPTMLQPSTSRDPSPIPPFTNTTHAVSATPIPSTSRLPSTSASVVPTPTPDLISQNERILGRLVSRTVHGLMAPTGATKEQQRMVAKSAFDELRLQSMKRKGWNRTLHTATDYLENFNVESIVASWIDTHADGDDDGNGSNGQMTSERNTNTNATATVDGEQTNDSAHHHPISHPSPSSTLAPSLSKYRPDTVSAKASEPSSSDALNLLSLDKENTLNGVARTRRSPRRVTSASAC